jgi:ribosomal protein S19E (S16A)
MKKFADAKRSERKFKVGDWVYLKLQSHRQISVQGKMGTHKLKQKFYGPFEILEKIGAVAYHLNLPTGSLIHHVFHISQLKKSRGGLTESVLPVPIVSPGGRIRVEPLCILDRRVVKKNKSTKMSHMERFGYIMQAISIFKA